MAKKTIISLINILILIFLALLLVYIGYRNSTYYEKFDGDGDESNAADTGTGVAKIKGNAIMLNGKNVASPSSVDSPSSGPSGNGSGSMNATIKTQDPQASTGEVPTTVIASPSAIATNNKVISATVPNPPKERILQMKSADIASIPKEVNPDLPPLNAGPVPLTPADLTPKEKQLFDAFLEKRITDDKVQELIEGGILNEEIIEKFLKLIDDMQEGPSVSKTPKKLGKNAPATRSDANLLEGFIGGGYAARY